MKPMHIALVTETFPPEINGVAMTLGRLAEGLRARGHRLSLTRPCQTAEAATEIQPDLHRVRGVPIPGYPGLRFGLARASSLVRHWQAARPDIVHIATEGPLGWAAMRAAQRLAIPTVASFHTQFHQYSRHYGIGWLQPILSGYLRGFHNRAQKTLVPTDTLARQLAADGYQNLGVMARGVDTQLFSPLRRDLALRKRWGACNNTCVVAYVGRIAPEKNLGLLFEAFAAIRQARPDTQLVLVGDGPALGKLAQAHPTVHFAGRRIGEDLARHYASADLFLLPSLTETFGNVLIEAMASGLPAVAFDYAAAEVHLDEGLAGHKVRPDDRAAFIRQATELGASPETRLRMGYYARQKTLGLAWQKVLDHLVADYRMLAGHLPSDSGQSPAAIHTN